MYFEGLKQLLLSSNLSDTIFLEDLGKLDDIASNNTWS